MGYENNASLSAAAAAAQAIHDRATSGSPIGAAAAQVAEEAATDAPPTAGTVPDFIRLILESIIERSVEADINAAADQEEEELLDDAAGDFAVAQQLTVMFNNAEVFADTLEMNGKGDVAEFVREAAKLVRKGANLARANARDVLADVHY